MPQAYVTGSFTIVSAMLIPCKRSLRGGGTETRLAARPLGT
jgi:hypothetical protein